MGNIRRIVFRAFILYILASLPVSLCSAKKSPEVSNDRWQGYSVGTFTLTRHTKESINTKKKTARFFKSVFFARNKDGYSIKLRGETNQSGHFIKKPNRVGGYSSQVLRPKLRIVEDTREISGISLVLVTTKYGPYYQDMLQDSYTCTRLKNRPHFVLESRAVKRDEWKGLNYNSISKRNVLSASRQMIFGKKVLVFQTEETRQINGLVRSRKRYSSSPDVPAVLLSREEIFDKNGKLLQVVTIELLDMGQAPDDVKSFKDAEQPGKYERMIPFDSDFARWQVQIDIERGYSPEHAAEMVENSPTQEVLYKQYEESYLEIKAFWESFLKDGDSQQRTDLLERLDKRNLVEMLRGPKSESLCKELVKHPDSDIQVKAAIILANMVHHRYLDLLADKLILHQNLDNAGLHELIQRGSEKGVANLARVLSEVSQPLDQVRVSYLGFAPQYRAMPVLIRHFRDSKSDFGRSSLLEVIQTYDSTTARDLVSNMAKTIRKNEILAVDQEKLALVRQVIISACILRIDGIKELMCNWLEWFELEPKSINPMIKFHRESLAGQILVSGLSLYDEKLNEHLRRLVKELPANSVIPALMLLEKEQTDAFERLNLDFSVDQISEIMNTSGMYPFVGEAFPRDFKLHLCPYLCQSKRDKVFMFVLKQVMPDYDPDVNLSEAWMGQSKSWYWRKTGKEPYRLNWETDNDLEMFFATLPKYGEPAWQLLSHLYSWKSFRPAIYNSVLRMEGQKRRQEWKLLISDSEERMERHETSRRLTLWSLGDTSMADEYESCLLDRVTDWRVYDVLPFLPKSELIRIAQKYYDDFTPEQWLKLAVGLSRYKDYKSAELLLHALDKQVRPENRVRVTQLINRAAGKNFGMRRIEMEIWAKSLSSSAQ